VTTSGVSTWEATVQVTVASFNLNNLFSRFNWEGTVNPAEKDVTYLRRDANGVESELPDVAYVVQRDSSDRLRRFRGKLIGAKDPVLTARIAERITAIDADVLLVQEVEDQEVLEGFNDEFLANRYREVLVLEGNDDRLIDVGLMVRGDLHIGRVTTWKHATNSHAPGRPIFSRDLLEVELLDAAGDVRLTVFNTHLKSHFVDRWNATEHRAKTPAEMAAEGAKADDLRGWQADSAAAIMKRAIGTPMLLAGDMNDPPASIAFDAWRDLGLVDALTSATETQPPPHVGNPQDVPTTQVWSDRFPVTGKPDEYRLFDHLWVSPGLENRVDAPLIHRRAAWTTSGSDHDPVSIELELV
jgi:endonuclease/exonuclease/phosphatase family metal-dependent hydrolase